MKNLLLFLCRGNARSISGNRIRRTLTHLCTATARRRSGGTTPAKKATIVRSAVLILKPVFAVSAVALFSFSLSSCYSNSFLSMESLKSRIGVSAFPGGKEYPDADAVVLYNLHDVDMYETNGGDIETDVAVTKVIKLLRNVDEHASVQIPVYSGDKIYGLGARTIEPDGSSIPLTESDFHRITGVGSDYIFYSDEQKVRFTFPAVSKGCIIEYHYELHESRPFIEDIWQIQGRFPELHNEYRLTLQTLFLVSRQNGGYGWDWRYKVYNCTLGNPAVHKSVDQNPDYQTVTLTWVKNNVPAFKPDPMMPAYMDYLKYVKFAPSEWKTWNDVAGWYYKSLFKPQMDITPAISEKATELTKGCADETQEIAKVFDFVQSLRYVAIELGEGGYIPSKPGVVLQRMYGDCKDESILLTSLLRSLGITAKPVLVLTSDEGTLDPGFPSWMFNHMIVKAVTKGGEDYWLDPTAGHCALGEIPFEDRGTNALVLNYDNTAKVERIPGSTLTQNAENISTEVTVTDSGEARFSVGMLFKGQENLETRDYLASVNHHDLTRYCKSLVADNFLSAEVTSCSLDSVDDPDVPLALYFKLRVPDAMQTQGRVIALNIDPFRISGDWSWLARDHRTYNIQFDYPHLITKTIEVQLPSSYRVVQLPEKTVQRTDGLYFSKSYRLSDSTHFDVAETFAVLSKTIDSKDFAAVKRFAEKVNDASKEVILLSKR